jgi:hypothetical protein
MSPSKDDISAFAVYNSKKNKRKRKRINSTNTGHIDDVTKTRGESDVEEMVNNEDEPSASNFCNATDEKKNRSDSSFTVVSEQPRTSGIEIVDIDEDSNDVLLIENTSKGKKRKIIVLSPESEDDVEGEEIILEDTTSRKRKSAKGMKNSSDNVVSEDEDIFVLEDEVAEEDSYTGNSLVEGRKLFAWLINPVVPEDFFR